MSSHLLYRVADARLLERRAIARAQLPADALMARAGAAAWAHLQARWPQARRIGVACGPGNNGGDGYVLARLAIAAGYDVQVVALAPPRSDEARHAEAGWRAAGGRTLGFEGSLPEVEVWVDAVFGIGLSRAPEGEAAAMIEALNAQPAPCFSLDVPSGVDADSGHVPGAAVRADLTLGFLLPLAGLHTGAARDHVGDLALDGLGVDPELFDALTPAALRVDREDLRAWLPPRRRNSHKGMHGRVLCIGGDHGFGGAIRLCGEAALRSGAGLVSVATRGTHVPALLAARPELMARSVEAPADLESLLMATDVLALGPGLGQGEWGASLFEAALAAGRPTVLDADGLNLLATGPRALPARSVLTPHPGEAARLLGRDAAAIQADRLGAATALADQHGAAVILKGAGSVVAAPDERPRVIGAGNPGLASGGSGDVLTGVVAALLGQGLTAFDAACAGALLHACAGDACAADGERGMLASDLFPWLRRLSSP